MLKITFYLFVVICLCSCSALNKTAKYKLNDGIYRIYAIRAERAYVSIEGDSAVVVPITGKRDGHYTFDTSQTEVYTSTIKSAGGDEIIRNFYHPSFDVDVLAIPFKYRPSIKGFPNQLDVNYSGALYLGYRTDKYQLNYERNPLDVYTRSVNHFGLSAGLIVGLGATDMNQWVTLNNINIEYEGLIFMKGLAITAALQNLTFGVALGTDNLLDKNHIYWIYQNKPWIGLTVGLNIN